MTRTSSPSRYLCSLLVATLLLLFAEPANAIKFEIQAYRYPPAKCIWNAAHKGALVIVTANVGPGEGQRLDIEIVDSGPEKNIYLNKRGITGEARFAITAHNDEGDVGVCFRNYLDVGRSTFFHIYMNSSLTPRSQPRAVNQKPELLT